LPDFKNIVDSYTWILTVVVDPLRYASSMYTLHNRHVTTLVDCSTVWEKKL